MSKSKPAKVEESVSGDERALVVFGRDEGGRPHASTFTAVESQLAERAAAFMSMSVLPVTTDEHRAAAAELTAGRIFSSGKGFVPFTTEARYERLEAFGEAFQPAPDAEPVAPTYTGVPGDWASISLGSLVLASEGPTRGFFEAVIVDAPGDDLFVCQWRDWPSITPFPRRREHLAILTDDLASLAEQLDAPLGEAGEAASAEA